MKKLFPILMLLSALLYLVIPNPVQAALYQSPYVNAVIRSTVGARADPKQVVHDLGYQTPVPYYAVVYENTALALTIEAFWLQGNTPVIVQQITPPNEWYNTTQNYAISNVINSKFYVAYQITYSTFALKQIQFTYNNTNYFSSFTIGAATIYEANKPIFDIGFSAIQTTDNKVWVGMITQEATLQATVFQISGTQILTTTTVSLPNWNFWAVQIERIGTQVYGWTWSTFGGASGILFYANNGTQIFTSTNYPQLSSIVQLTNNTIGIVFSGSGTNTAYSIMYSSSSSHPERSIPLIYANSMSAFSMSNNRLGFFFTDTYGLNAAYHATNQTGFWSWTAVLLPNNNPSLVFTQEKVYADRDTNILSQPAHATAWVDFLSGVTHYHALVSIDLVNINSISYSTSYSTYATTQYWTYISVSTTYSAYTTISTTSTISMSQIQTSGFMTNLIILVIFLLVPAGLFAWALGSMGFTLGAFIGAVVAYVFGKMPLWLLLIISLLMSLLLLLSRGQNESQDTSL